MAGRGAYNGPGIGLRPLVAPGLRVLFCGYNPSIPAWRSGHYYANPSNRFYHLLHVSGLTPRLLAPAEDALLLDFGIGVTDLCSIPSAMARDLPARQFAAGNEALSALVRACMPRVLCCNGYGVFRALFGTAPQRPGLQKALLYEGAPVFAVPSSSGAASVLTAVRVSAWRELAAFLGSVDESCRPRGTD